MFTKPLPEWNKIGATPPQSKKDAGWTANEKPPADWFNWFQNLTYEALKELQQNAISKDGSVAFTGPIAITLPADPTLPMQAVTKQLLDAEIAKAKKYAP
jgi:hypothetical protein